MEKLRILIVEDSPLWANHLKAILSNEPLYEVIGSASDGRLGLKKAEDLRPDLLLVDINLPTLNGIELAHSVQHLLPKPFVIFVSEHRMPSIVEAAVKVGNAYVLKTSADAELLPAIITVCRGERFLSSILKGQISD